MPSGSSRYAFSDVYAQNFNPRTYLDTYYASVKGDQRENEFRPFITDTNFILSQHLPKGMDRALEFGCGPCVDALMPAVGKFKTAYYADFLPGNLSEVNRWMAEERDAFDATPFAERYATLANDRGRTRGIQNVLRSKFGGTMKCDVFAQNPLPNNTDMRFDFIYTALCLEGACTTLTDYKIAILKLTNLLNPGGHVLQICVLDQDKYEFAGTTYPSLNISFEQVKESWHEASCTIVDTRHIGSVAVEGLGVSIGVCGVLVRKL